jgi:DNA repair exonuclease SbcCD ATPase subunit
LSQKINRLILPFAVLSENRTEPFSEEMQKASIYCFAELEREKGGGLILRKPEEKLVFLAEFCYPLWLIPWEELSLIFDGLKTTTHTLTYRDVPDVKSFIENMQRSSRTLETYMAFLSDNTNYFQVPTNEKAMAIEALVTEPTFFSELSLYLSGAEKLETPQSEMAFLPTAIDESVISSTIQELENLKLEFKEDVSLLYESMKLLNKTTRNFTKTIRAKIRAIKEEYNAEIKKQENVIMPKVNRINEEYDEQVTQLTEKFEKQLLPLQKEKVKLEKTREQVRNKIERCKIEAQTCAANKDEVGEKKWKEKANESKKEFSEIEGKIEEIEEKIKEIEESRSLETFRLRSEWEAKIREAKKSLLELEAARDAKIQIHNQEIKKLEGTTSTIIKQIDSTVKLREANLANLEKLGIQQKRKDYGLIYVPFYMACYQAELKKRYVLFSPSVASSIGFTTKLRGALGKAKVKQLLAPRFKSITSFLNKFPALIERNAVFEREINESGEKADMLKASSIREQIKSGLERLRGEGWLSEKEYEAFAEAYSKT